MTNDDYDCDDGDCDDDDDDDYDERIIRKPRRILRLSILFTPSIPPPSADVFSPHSKWLEPRAIPLQTVALSVDHKPALSTKACADRQGRLQLTTIGSS